MAGSMIETTGTDTGPNHRAARTAFIAFLLLATVMWIGIAVGANIRTPGIVGLLTTVVGGLCAATLTAAIGGWVALKLAQPQRTADPARIDGADPALAPALIELERAQQPVARRMVERASVRMPVGAAIGVVIWSVLVLLGAPGGFFDFALVLLGGGLAGYGWARFEAGRDLGDAFLKRGVDTLVKRHGEFGWRGTTSVSHRWVAPGAAKVETHGEVAGVRTGVQVRLAPVKAAGANGQGGFTGLVVELESARLRAASMEELSRDEPAAIALIEQLATLPGFGRPTCLAAAGRLSIAVPETARPRVFDAPAGAGTKEAAPRLARVDQALRAVLQVADALAAPTPA
jgi:hypothetical protein